MIDGRLVATAGSDELWVVDDIATTVLDELQACWSATPPLPEALSSEGRLAVAELRGLGVLRPDLPFGRQLTVGIVWAGTPVTLFADSLARARTVVDPTDADVVLVVRTTATLTEWAGSATPLVARGAVQLPVDLAAAHTIAVGPLVVPGHGPCLACLVGRVSRRWSDVPPPASPGATEPASALVAAGLVERQLAQLADHHFPLAERTVSLDIDELVTTESPCLQSARCPVCADVETDGRMDLPW